MKLSACIIARNEQEQIGRCLKSIQHLCDEIVVVDTGSTDKTVEIAESFGARVYHHEWQDDFSLHRNQVFDYATGDWYLVIDCDEELVSDKINPLEFKKRLANIAPEISCLIITTQEEIDGVDIYWPGYRFLRASANPRYKYAAHNKLIYEGYSAETDIILRHYGYDLDPVKRKAKRQRVERMLRKRMNNDPDDFAAMYYMCQLKVGIGDWDEVIKWGNMCRDLVPFTKKEELQYLSVLYYWMGLAHLAVGNGGWAASWLKTGGNLFPEDIDINYGTVLLGYMSDDTKLITEAAKRYFQGIKDRAAGGERFKHFCNISTRDKYVIPKTVYCSDPKRQQSVRDMLKEMGINLAA